MLARLRMQHDCLRGFGVRRQAVVQHIVQAHNPERPAAAAKVAVATELTGLADIHVQYIII
jgi:redox-regulated HSP33 family molecular chaperone